LSEFRNHHELRLYGFYSMLGLQASLEFSIFVL
jgi:hypothetical protein